MLHVMNKFDASISNLFSHEVYSFLQHSLWKKSDGSLASDINWGLSYLYPHHTKIEEGDSCTHCVSHNLTHGIPRTNTWKSPQQHCSALEIFPDHSHVSMFPVNCTAKYWSRVICEDRNNTKRNNIAGGLGEYWIRNNTLRQLYYMCPEEFYFVISGFCMSLTLFDKNVLLDNILEDRTLFMYFKHFINYLDEDTLRLFDNDMICMSGNTNTISYKTVNLSTSSPLVMTDVLEEFYPEGSDIYPFIFRHLNIYELGLIHQWLPAPNYPTYVPCFASREQIIIQTTNDVSVYRCEDDSLIADVLVCNGRDDCRNSEDERGCPSNLRNNSHKPLSVCSKFHYECDGGGCVHYDHVCDSFADCPQGDDELNCHDKNKFSYFDISIIRNSFITDLCDPPSGDMLMCRTKLQCYTSSAICHYDHSGGVMAHCEDGSHLGWGTHCHFIECRLHYKCKGSYCIPTRKVCDGVTDCPVGDDEASCEAYSCPLHMRCSGVTFCVPPHEICDGISHCPQQEDEKYCQVCPKECQCKGTVIYCYNVTSSMPSNLFSPSALLLYNSYTIFVDLYNLSLVQMNYVYLLDLRYGSFASLLETQHFPSVKFLYLIHQGLYVLPSYFINGPNIIYLNLSYNIIHSVNPNAFSLMRNMKTLSLQSNRLNIIEAHFWEDLRFLTHLYLGDNQLKSIAASTFLDNPELVLIRSDHFMVCCVAIDTEDCQPQTQFVSSCFNLISSISKRVVIILQGIIVVVGNIGALVAELTLMHNTTAAKYLIVSLMLSDLLMGPYLLSVASVDLTYNMVFYKIASEWTNSVTCIMIGMVNFISCEVSLLMLCMLAYVRMISIQKVGGMSHITARIRKVCICAWVVILACGVSYAVYLVTQNAGLHNNMCIFLGISQSYQKHVTNLEHALQIVFIIINTLLLLVMVISMVTLFYFIAKSYFVVMRTSGQRVRSQEVRLVHIGLKLLLLLACNILTWLPFLTVSIILHTGTTVHENVLQWVIVLGLPICACINPLLYNFASIRAHLKENKK